MTGRVAGVFIRPGLVNRIRECAISCKSCKTQHLDRCLLRGIESAASEHEEDCRSLPTAKSER